MTKRDRILLAVIGTVVVLGGIWWMVVKPANADASASRAELAQIQSESGTLRDTLTRAAAVAGGGEQRTAERLRVAKAIPEGVETPGALVQIQRLADRSNVELTSITTDQYSEYGSLRGTQFTLVVAGRFFDVDDFLYRLHRQVSLDDRQRPRVAGRLLATTSIDITLDPSEQVAPGPEDRVTASLKVLAFSAQTGGTSVGAAPVAGTPIATAPAAAPAATTPPPTGGSGSEPSTAPAPATTTPSTGGTP